MVTPASGLKRVSEFVGLDMTYRNWECRKLPYRDSDELEALLYETIRHNSKSRVMSWDLIHTDYTRLLSTLDALGFRFNLLFGGTISLHPYKESVERLKGLARLTDDEIQSAINFATLGR